MANGCSALPLAPADVTVDEPGISLEAAIGEATASAVTALCQGWMEFESGERLSAATRAAGGERIAKLYMLQQQAGPNLDFAATARREGARVLRQYFTSDFYLKHGPGAGETTIDAYLDGVLEILAKVVAFERAMAN
jgi:hypothetical protein